MRHCEPFSKTYKSLVSEIMDVGTTEKNERTGVEIKMIEGGASFKLDLSYGKLPVVGNRAMYPHIAAAETAWQFMGTKDPSFIMAYAPKLWSKFIEDDELKTAYGYRWREHFGRDQLIDALNQLVVNQTNRQLYISAWDPSADGLGADNQPKNIPCPVGFSVSRSKDKLHMSVFLRSSDVFVGLPYDVMGYALTMDAIAASVGITPASLHVTLAHPHIYKPHWGYANAHLREGDIIPLDEKGLSLQQGLHEPSLPGWTVDQILKNPGAYVDTVRRLSKRVVRHKWDPMPKVVE